MFAQWRLNSQAFFPQQDALSCGMAKNQLTPETKTSYSVPALEKGFNVIELLTTAPSGLTMSEIASRLGFKSASEIFRVLLVMERRQWLFKNPDTDRYTLTHSTLQTVLRALPTHDLLMVAPPLMLELSRDIEQSCHLVVLNGNSGLVLARQESPGPTGFAVKRGSEIDAVRTCSGHVLMAFSNPILVESVMRDNPVDDAEKARIERVRHVGYEMMPSIRTRGVTDISCPIFGSDGYAAAALTVPFLELIDGTQKVAAEDALRILIHYAHQISQGIGSTLQA
jgi:DNA-binding IclR family transcriptional regulator